MFLFSFYSLKRETHSQERRESNGEYGVDIVKKCGETKCREKQYNAVVVEQQIESITLKGLLRMES